MEERSEVNEAIVSTSVEKEENRDPVEIEGDDIQILKKLEKESTRLLYDARETLDEMKSVSATTENLSIQTKEETKETKTQKNERKATIDLTGGSSDNRMDAFSTNDKRPERSEEIKRLENVNDRLGELMKVGNEMGKLIDSGEHDLFGILASVGKNQREKEIVSFFREEDRRMRNLYFKLTFWYIGVIFCVVLICPLCCFICPCIWCAPLHPFYLFVTTDFRLRREKKGDENEKKKLLSD